MITVKIIARIYLVFLLLTPLAARSQSTPLYVLGNATNSQVEATGSNTPRTAGARAADVVNVLDFGADPTDTTDSTTAINAAIAQVRLLTSTPATLAAKLVFPNGTYKTLGSINMTSLRGQAVTIDGGGAAIDCQATGLPCIDAFDSRWLRIYNLAVVGSAVNTPTYGIQMGTISSTRNSDDHLIDGVFVTGAFTTAAWYLRCTETSQFNHMYGWSSVANSYGLIEDGFNHWNPPSAFTTVTQAVDTAQSFLSDTFVAADFRESGGGGSGIWMGYALNHKFIRSYIGNASGYAITLFSEGAFSAIYGLDADIHIETTGVTDVFYVSTLASGGNTTPTFQGLYYNDTGPKISNSIFKLDANTTGVTLGDLRLSLGGINGSATKIFDNPTPWCVSGRVALPGASTLWNATCSQVEMFTGSSWNLGFYGSAPIVSALADGTARGGNTRGANAVDLQTTRTAGSQAAIGANSVIAGGSNNAASQQYAAVLGGFVNFASGNSTAILGGQGNTLTGFGSSSLGGLNQNDRGRYGPACHSSGDINAQGDSQTCFTNLKATASSTTPVVLTANSVASNTTVVNIPASSAYTLTVELMAIDHTTVTNNYSWVLPQALLTRGTTIGTTAISLGTPTILSNGTVTGLSVALTADTTNGGITLTFTPPSGNTDTWDITAFVTSVEGL